MKRILVNKIRCRKCGDILESFHVHDAKSCNCGECFVDGGQDYIRRIKGTDYEELSIIAEDIAERREQS